MSKKHIHRRRDAAHGGVLATAPWRRAPIVLFRQPIVFLAIVGAAAILAIAAASGPLFLSTIGTASLHAQAEQRCPETGLPTVTATIGSDQIGTASKEGVQVFAKNGLPNAYYSADGFAHIEDSLVHLYSRKGALDHVTKLTAANGTGGVWLPNVFATKIGAKPGATIKTVSGIPLHVTGIYRDMAPDPYSLANLPRYWCTYTNQIVSTVATDQQISQTPPEFRQGPWIIADDASVSRASEAGVQMLWSSPMSSVTNPLSSFDVGVKRTARAADDLTDLLAVRDPAWHSSPTSHTGPARASPDRSSPSRSPA